MSTQYQQQYAVANKLPHDMASCVGYVTMQGVWKQKNLITCRNQFRVSKVAECEHKMILILAFLKL